MKKIVILLLALLLTGCGAPEPGPVTEDTVPMTTVAQETIDIRQEAEAMTQPPPCRRTSFPLAARSWSVSCS